MILRARNGQSIIEYGVLIIIVAASLIAMTTYLMRATNARIRQSINELNYYCAD
ncbi:MAG: hypothetical protein PHY35_01770 [Candidatus Omnitrophica bacterium]|nr:hypothetical protein [Candidatus Omnitrophota bacterium]